MKRKPFNKTTMLVATIALCVIIVAGATYSWFTSTQNRVNRFETADFDGNTTLFERFDPPKDWKPGTEVLKQVGVLNSGDIDVLVRISFHEMLKKLNSNTLTTTTVKDASKIPVTCKIDKFTTSPWVEVTSANLAAGSDAIPANMHIWALEYETSKKFGFFVYEEEAGPPVSYNRIDALPGAITYDGTKFVVKSSLLKYMYYGSYLADNEKFWVSDYSTGSLNIAYPPTTYNTGSIYQAMTDSLIKLGYVTANMDTMANIANPSSNGKWVYSEGYFYYIGKLAPGTVSPLVLNSVTLDKSADNSYQHMVFDLTVEMQAIQATAETIADVWKLPTSGPSEGAKIYAKLVSLL